MKKNNIFIKLLKKHTDIDTEFINTFFQQFKVGSELDFNIKDSDIIKYLGIKMITLRNRLLNIYSKKKIYFENVDYIKIKAINTNNITYVLNYPCFEKIAMESDSPKSETIKLYFIKLRQFLTDNHELIYQAVENKEELDIYSGYESIYFIAIDERKPDILKVGRTNDIVKRLRNYNVGRIKDVDLKYLH
jgi:phage anti-repressor protein